MTIVATVTIVYYGICGKTMVIYFEYLAFSMVDIFRWLVASDVYKVHVVYTKLYIRFALIKPFYKTLSSIPFMVIWQIKNR